MIALGETIVDQKARVPAHQNKKFRSQGWVLLVSLILADMINGFELTMIYTAFPTIRRAFSGSPDTVWLLTAGLLVSAAAAAMCGRLGDLYGRARILVLVMAVSGLGSFLAAAAPNLGWLVLGSAFQGTAGAILPLCMAIAKERLPGEHLPFAVSVLLCATMIAAILGFFLSGTIIVEHGWQAVYMFSGTFSFLATGGVVATLGFRGARSEVAAKTNMFLGSLFVPAIALFLFGVTEVETLGLRDWRVWSSLAASIALAVIWVKHQLLQASPLIDLRLMCSRNLGLPYLCIGLLGVGALQHTFIMTQFLQASSSSGLGLGLSAIMTGYVLIPVRLAGVVGSLGGGRIVRARGERSVMIGAAFAVACGWLLLYAFPKAPAAVFIGMMVEGTGHMAIVVAISSAILRSAPLERSGEAAGLVAVFRATAVAVGTPLVSSLIAAHGSEDGRGYLSAFAFIASITLLIAFVAWFMPARDERGLAQQSC